MAEGSVPTSHSAGDNYLEEFVKDLLVMIGAEEQAKKFKLTDDETGFKLSADILNRLNKFLYQKHIEGDDEFISKYHAFWEENHERILQPRIDEEKCRQVAQLFEQLFTAHPDYKPQIPDLRLSKEQICNVRFFTALQDFKVNISRKDNPYALAKTKPYLFDANHIVADHPANVQELLQHLGAVSQADKRMEWALRSANLLIENYGGSAFNIISHHKGDVAPVFEVLVPESEEEKLGFSRKKVNMFLRDMKDLGVWEYRKNEYLLDVASDINTMKVALRSGILRVRIPLLTSYLDVYCYQYGTVDEYTALAWRRVWELWENIANNHRVAAPAYTDFLIYNVGRKNCTDRSIHKLECECSKVVFGSKRKKICPRCGERALTIVDSFTGLLCERFAFTHPLSPLGAKVAQPLTDNRGDCILNEVCDSKHLNPPQSISIWGATGWESGKTDEGGGGGIMA